LNQGGTQRWEIPPLKLIKDEKNEMKVVLVFESFWHLSKDI